MGPSQPWRFFLSQDPHFLLQPIVLHLLSKSPTYISASRCSPLHSPTLAATNVLQHPDQMHLPREPSLAPMSYPAPVYFCPLVHNEVSWPQGVVSGFLTWHSSIIWYLTFYYVLQDILLSLQTPPDNACLVFRQMINKVLLISDWFPSSNLAMCFKSFQNNQTLWPSNFTLRNTYLGNKRVY